jgi:hypothetical protein
LVGTSHDREVTLDEYCADWIYSALVVARARPFCDHTQEELLTAARGKSSAEEMTTLIPLSANTIRGEMSSSITGGKYSNESWLSVMV